MRPSRGRPWTASGRQQATARGRCGSTAQAARRTTAARSPATASSARPSRSSAPASRQADFIAAQDATAPRGPAGPATRRYLLAGLLACGQCGRRLESAWSNSKPAYRCRHGHTSAARPEPGRPKNTYIREGQILPHLAALAILLSSDDQALPDGTMQVTAPGEAAGLIDQLRTAGITLPTTRTPGPFAPATAWRSP